MKPWPLSSVLKRFDVLAATDQGLQCADMLQVLRCSALVVCKSHVLINKGKLLAAVSNDTRKTHKKGNRMRSTGTESAKAQFISSSFQDLQLAMQQ